MGLSTVSGGLCPAALPGLLRKRLPDRHGHLQGLGQDRQRGGLFPDLPAGHLLRLSPRVPVRPPGAGAAPAPAGAGRRLPGLYPGDEAALPAGGPGLRRGPAVGGQAPAGGEARAAAGRGLSLLPGGAGKLRPVGPGGLLLRRHPAPVRGAALLWTVRGLRPALRGVGGLQAPDAHLRPPVPVLCHPGEKVAAAGYGDLLRGGGAAARRPALYHQLPLPVAVDGVHLHPELL